MMAIFMGMPLSQKCRGATMECMKRIIGVMGGSSCTPEEQDLARAAGRRVAERGFVLLCGGGPA